jgi:hypothetical protein
MIRRYDFPSICSSSANSHCLYRTWPLTQLFGRYTPTLGRIIRCWRPRSQNVSGSFLATVGWTAAHPSVHPVLKASSWRVSVLFKLDHWIDRRFLPMDRRFIRRCCPRLLFSNSFDATTKGNVGSSDGIKLTPAVALCTKYSDAMHWWYRRFIRRCVFFSFLCSVLTLEK